VLKTILSYVLSIGGLLVVLSAVIPVFAHYVQYREARALLFNLLRAQPSRVAPICLGSPGTFFEGIAAAIKTGAMVGSADPKVIPTATRPAYDAATQAVGMKLRQLFGRGKLGGMMAVAGAAIAISTGKKPLIVLVCAGLAAVGVIAIAVRRGAVDREIVLARAEILPEVDRAFAERRL
jgi:hypothetical protein